jgi:hypothetical protein
MIDPDAVVEARRLLGRQLAAFRTAAGLNQHQLAEVVHYGRSTIANVKPVGRITRLFWERCDHLTQQAGHSSAPSTNSLPSVVGTGGTRLP